MEYTATMKKSCTPAFKAQVVQDLLKETKTLTQLATDHNVHPNVLWDWRTTALAGLPSLFTKADSVASLRATYEQQQEDLFAQIGRLTTQLAWLKKLALTLTRAERLLNIELANVRRKFRLEPIRDHIVRRLRPWR